MYDLPAQDAELTQGDILDSCPIMHWKDTGQSNRWQPTQTTERVVILTQACDLANSKATRVQVAVVHDVRRIVQSGIVSAGTIKDQVRTHRVFGWYFLPEHPELLSESIVDLRDVHTVPRSLLAELCQKGMRVARILSPYREHMAQHFAVTFSRVALPQPYETK